MTRSFAIERTGAVERPLRLAELRDADGAFLTTAGRGIVPLADVDGHRLPAHPLVAELAGGMAGAVIVILDNRDSFVLNVQHRLWEIGVDSVVVPSHATRLDEIEDRRPAGIIVSPGPQGPDEAGISTAAIRVFGARMPVLGICLGHQCIAVAHGVPVAPNANACHGQASPIEHDGAGVLAGPAVAVRGRALPRAGRRRAAAGLAAGRCRRASPTGRGW